MNVWDKLANKYDTLWVQKYSLIPSRNKILFLIKDKKEDSVFLDVGCGTGQLLLEIKEKYPKAKLFGIDKSKSMIEGAKGKTNDIVFECIAAENFEANTKMDIITCCHSFPYYVDKHQVLQKLSNLLKDDGEMIFIQSSINNSYDKFVMYIIEKTAEKADYLSIEDFCKLTEKYFVIKDTFTIKEKWFMPSICGFVLGKKL